MLLEFNRHALFRLEQRCKEFNIPFDIGKELAIATVRRGMLSRKHRSRRNATYCCYFDNALNLTFYVLCSKRVHENQALTVIKTVIIEEGRD